MKELLAKLQKADPICYEDIRSRVIIDVDEDFVIYAENQKYRENVDDTIQGCVQRACEKRKWYWQAAHGEHIGYVASARDGGKIVNGQSVAEAALVAFIAEVENEKTS